MGNTLGVQRLDDLRSYLLDSPDIVVHSLLATYKLFKVFHCAHEGYKHGGVIVKLFITNGMDEDDITSDSIRSETLLKPYRDAVFLVQCRFSGFVHPNVVPYESAEILDRSAILVRQFFGRNLFDRIYSQPRPGTTHQLWIAIQILSAVAQMHSVGIIHGDIKPENVFVTGSFHAILTDPATFIKPVYLPLNDPVAATTLFFESGIKRRRCFTAPERFIESLTSRVLDEHGRRMTFFDKEFTSDFIKMDLFSAGLAIAEMFLEGQHIMDLPELLAYRAGTFDLQSILDKIPDVRVRDLVTRMTERDPHMRPTSANECLEILLKDMPRGIRDCIVPLYTVSGHPVYANPDMRMMLIRSNWRFIFECLTGNFPSDITQYDMLTELEIFDHSIHSSLVTRGITSSVLPLTEWSSRESHDLFPHPKLSSRNGNIFTKNLLNLWQEGARVHQESNGSDAWRANSSHRINEIYNQLFDDSASCTDPTGEASKDLVPLIAAMLGNTVMACSWSKSKKVYLDMIESISDYADNDCVSDLIIPYVHDLIMVSTDMAIKGRAIEVMISVVKKISFAETGLFSEYLFPICLLTDQPLVVPLAGALAMEAIRLSRSDSGGRKRAAIRQFLDKVIDIAFMKNRSDWYSQIVKSWEMFDLLHDEQIDKLVGRLPELAMFGDQNVRIAFCNHVGKLKLKPKQIEAVLIPLLVQLLSDPEITVVSSAIRGLGIMVRKCSMGTISHMVSKMVPLLYHPVLPVRSAIERTLVYDVGRHVSAVDQFVFLRNVLPPGCRTLLDLALPVIKPLPLRVYEILLSDIVDLSPFGEQDKEGITALKPFIRRRYSGNGSRVLIERDKSTVSESNLVLGNHINLSIHILNPHFESSRPSTSIISRNEEITLSLANHRDWRYDCTLSPKPPKDIGCLSGPDGSLSSLYNTPPPVGSQSSLQRKYLSTLPCVPSVASQKSISAWKPESLLLATLNDFGSTPVVSVDSTDDGRVIAAAGSDGSIKVWRMSSLETESVIQATKQFKVADATRMYRMKTLRNSKSIVTGSDDRLVIYRIDSGQITDAAVAPSFKSEIHKYGHVLELETVDTDTNCIVMAACERGGVLCWDTRIANFAWDIPISPVNYSWPTGLISCKDATAFSVAFITGEVLIFDNRFLKPVRSFSITSGSITGTGHSSQSNSIWINSANDCCLFDIESGGEAKQVLTVNSSGSPPSTYPTLLPATPSFPDWNPMVKSLKSEGGSRCVIECPMGNSWTVLTGHNDGVVRYWNTDQETQTSGIAYPMQLEKPVVTFSGVHQCQRSRRDFEPSSDALNNIAGNPCQITEMHRDVVNDMCIASLQYDIIATGGRDGLVKLWK